MVCLQVKALERIGSRDRRYVLFGSAGFNERSCGNKARKSGKDGYKRVEVLHDEEDCRMLTEERTGGNNDILILLLS